ncbi:MAG: TonB family protein [Chitinophagales bacterium]
MNRTFYVLLTCLLVVVQYGKAQNAVYEQVSQMPEFRGAKGENWQTFASEPKNFPAQLQHAFLKGNVVVNFVVNEDGTLSNIRLRKTANPQLNAVALSVIRSTEGKWLPGKENGVAVKVAVNVPFDFAPAFDDKKKQFNFYKKIESNMEVSHAFDSYQRGDFEAAIPMWKKIVANIPSDPDYINFLGWCYYYNFEKEQACEIWTNAARRLDKKRFGFLVNQYCVK